LHGGEKINLEGKKKKEKKILSMRENKTMRLHTEKNRGAGLP